MDGWIIRLFESDVRWQGRMCESLRWWRGKGLVFFRSHYLVLVSFADLLTVVAEKAPLQGRKSQKQCVG